MDIAKLLERIDKFAPFDLVEDWDNSGLIVGTLEDEVRKIGVCLDATYDAVVAADLQECNVIVCHHPLIFKPIKSIIHEHKNGDIIMEAIRHDINIIALHTNWDLALGGVNDTLASLLGLQNVKVLDSDSGFGAFGVLKKPMPTRDFLEHVKISWQLTHLDHYTYTENMEISRVALCGGAGSAFWKFASDFGANVYITADMKYHELIDARNALLPVCLVDHGEMERASLPALAKKFSDLKIKTIILDDKKVSAPFDTKALHLPIRL